jgi:hypothetical protein
MSQLSALPVGKEENMFVTPQGIGAILASKIAQSPHFLETK